MRNTSSNRSVCPVLAGAPPTFVFFVPSWLDRPRRGRGRCRGGNGFHLIGSRLAVLLRQLAFSINSNQPLDQLDSIVVEAKFSIELSGGLVPGENIDSQKGRARVASVSFGALKQGSSNSKSAISR
jgi:hypothetical protein